MTSRDRTRLLTELREAYARRSPASAALGARAMRFLVDGGSHAIRLMQPFPPRIASAGGARVRDEDGHDILDYWQGHLANLLGHNPPVVTEALAEAFRSGSGLQTGFTDRLQLEVAEMVCRRTGADKVRFTTSGALATMYSLMLARAFTGREFVLKTGGGWHGAQPWALKGVSYQAGDRRGYTSVDSDGIPRGLTDQVIVAGFNDLQSLEDQFRRYGDRVACFIVEPFIGAGGLMPSTRQYLETARRLTRDCGALLILDEVVSGFRFRAGDMGALYGVKPDLAIFGKIMGGGMPVAAVAGRGDVLSLAGSRVKFSGGTFSAHPASMLAARTMIGYLVDHEKELYGRLAEMGEKTRSTVESAFREEGFCVRCTGRLPEMTEGSSLFMIHIPYRDDEPLEKPEDLFDPARCDVELSGPILQLALLLEDVHLIHSHGGVSTAHTEEDLSFLAGACRRAARRLRAAM